MMPSFVLTVALATEAVDQVRIDACRQRVERDGEGLAWMLQAVISWTAWTSAKRVVEWAAECASARSRTFGW